MSETRTPPAPEAFGLAAEAADDLAEVWGEERTAALIRKLHEKAVEAREANLSGVIAAEVQLHDGKPVRMKVRSEESV